MQFAFNAVGALQGPSQAEMDLPSLSIGSRPMRFQERSSRKLLGSGLTLRSVGSLPEST